METQNNNHEKEMQSLVTSHKNNVILANGKNLRRGHLKLNLMKRILLRDKLLPKLFPKNKPQGLDP